jgi:hypothetical protein
VGWEDGGVEVVPLDERVAEALGRVRRAFGKYPVRAVVEACPCCWGGRARPADEDLFTLSIRLGNTVGTGADLKAHLPKLLEALVTTGELDESITLGRLRDRPGWPADEREAVDAYLSAVWRAVLRRWPADLGSLRSTAGFLAAVPGDPSPYLHTWDLIGTPEANRHLADLVEARMYGRRLPAVVVAWVDGAHDRLLRAFEADPDGPYANAYAEAVYLLEATGTC